MPQIVALFTRLPGVSSVCDIFTGTTRVAQGLKSVGFHVHANDLATYSEVFAQTYIATDADAIDLTRVTFLLDKLMAVESIDGYATETFCRQARYFQEKNGMRIDAIRPAIDTITSDPTERAILLTSLIEAADRVDSTTGLQMAYLKQWAPRSFLDLALRVPEMLSGTGSATRMDANELAPQLSHIDACYIDPPYNAHSYYSNYHIWETIARGDAPTSYGVACKREDCKTTKSDYNSKRRAWDAFSSLINSLPTPNLVVSFSNEGFFDFEDIVALLSKDRAVRAVPVAHKRYVGAQIGIHNPKGERVGAVSHLQNTEYLFVAAPDEAAVEQAVSEASPATQPV